MSSRCTPTDRARNCCAAVDRLWERCQTGVDYVFPAPDMNVSPTKQRKAARLLFSLIEAANRLEVIARTADLATYRAWVETRKHMYTDKGWNWPPDQQVAKETRTELVQLAWGD